jgi:hypothetical protein
MKGVLKVLKRQACVAIRFVPFPAKLVLKEVNWVEKCCFIIKVSHGKGVRY